MTIAETLLPKLNEWEAAGLGRQSWAQPVGDRGWALNLEADRVDSLGCLIWELTLTRTGDNPLSSAVLKQRAAAVADRITGLMEPIHLVEVDETRGEALLRSETPAHRSHSLAYYELIMHGNRIDLRRFQFANGKIRREQVAFGLTYEAIAKLVDDLVRE